MNDKKFHKENVKRRIVIDAKLETGSWIRNPIDYDTELKITDTIYCAINKAIKTTKQECIEILETTMKAKLQAYKETKTKPDRFGLSDIQGLKDGIKEIKSNV